MVFAGTGHAFFYSRDDGKTWTQFKDKLPAAPVNWIEVPKNAAEVAVATYGRGVWILRDIWQLEHGAITAAAQAGRAAAAQAACPAIAHGGRRHGGVRVLAARRRRPRRSRWRSSTPTARCISTSQVHGARRTEPGVVESAVSRRPNQPVLRSIPPDNPYIWDAGRWQNRERPVTHWGLGAQRLAAARRARQVHRAHDATTASSTRSRSRSGAT